MEVVGANENAFQDSSVGKTTNERNHIRIYDDFHIRVL